MICRVRAGFDPVLVKINTTLGEEQSKDNAVSHWSDWLHISLYTISVSEERKPVTMEEKFHPISNCNFEGVLSLTDKKQLPCTLQCFCFQQQHAVNLNSFPLISLN